MSYLVKNHVMHAPGPSGCMRAKVAATTAAVSLGIQLALIGPSFAVENSPYESRDMAYGPTVQGTVQSCQLNPNCISTASTNESYGPAWRSDESEPNQSARVLKSAILASSELDPIFLDQRALGDRAIYLSFTFPPPPGWGPSRDLVEFIIKPDLPASNASRVNAADGNDTGCLVTYRGVAGNVKYLYPWTTPLTDFKTQERRLEKIRQMVGWQRLGCELIECYSFPSDLF